MGQKGLYSFSERVMFRALVHGMGETRIIYFSGSLSGRHELFIASAFNDIAEQFDHEMKQKYPTSDSQQSKPNPLPVLKIVLDFSHVDDVDDKGIALFHESLDSFLALASDHPIQVECFATMIKKDGSIESGFRLLSSLQDRGVKLSTLVGHGISQAMRTVTFHPAKFKKTGR